MSALNLLAFDLGAESGRAILGHLDGERLRLSDLHRFPNGPVRLPDGLHWDVLRLWSEIKHGISLALREIGQDLASIGIDTWGVDFGLLDRDGALVGSPYHYRDSRTDGMLDEAFRRVPRAEIFQRTGIQFMQINSLYQLLAMAVRRSPALEIAAAFLTMPDLFNYWLTGQRVCEFSNATTTQCFDPRRCDWARDMLEQLGIPTGIFPPVVQPGTSLGRLAPDLAEELGALPGSGPLIIAPACHDTGSAVAAVPAEAPGFAWISSGTWSVVGAEVPEPIITHHSLAYNFTNEGGVCGTFRFSRNVMGLWLVQECRRTWAGQGQAHTYDELAQMASQAKPFLAVLDPDDGEFLKPGDMPARIRRYCQRTGQPVPETEGEIVRCALEGIALKYRWVLEHLEEMLGRRLEPLHIVGGGTQNRLLSQLTADAVGRAVVTGPVEATASGNLLMQLMALGRIATLAEGRQIVRRSFEMDTFEPGDRACWDEAYARLLALMPAQP
jgi:rhamnulokinase